jgi:hypothetical protein
MSGGIMKNPIFVLLSLVSFSLVNFATAQNRLYVRVEQNSMALLGYGGSTFLYDHILLLPDGTAVRFDDTNTDDGIDVPLPSNINLATATATELVGAGGTQGTYQDDSATVTTSFGVSFVSSGEKYSGNSDENGYMLITALPATLVTGQYKNSSTAMMGSNPEVGTQIMAGSSSTYDFYPDGSFSNAESSAVSSTTNNPDGVDTGVTSSNEGGSAGTYVFEGYNLFLTMSDGSQSIFPAYLWPAYQPLEDQILMIDGSEYLTQDDSTIPFTQAPANGSAPTNSPGNNPDGGQNPLAQPQTETANPLAQPTEATQNPLQTPPETETATPSGASPNTLSGTVTAPEGVTLSSAYVIVCPTNLVDTNDCLTAPVQATGTYTLELPAGVGEYIVIAAMDADANGELSTGDYSIQDSFDMNGDEARTLDLSLEPYTE